MDGGFPTPVDLPMAYDGSFSGDSTKLAYMPISPAFESWKRYRGGETTSIWLANLADAKVEKIPRENSNDFNPIWLGEKVYFLSDRAGPVSLFSYDTATKKIATLVHNDGYDIKSASAGPGVIVYEQFGSIHLFDLKSGKAKKIEITVSGDIPSLRPSFEKLASRISNASLSPTGARAVFEARGEIFTVPAEKGDVRNLTNTPGVAERNPAWSSGRQTDRLFFGRIRRIRAACARAKRPGRGAEDRSRRPAHFLLRSQRGRPTARRSPMKTASGSFGTSIWKKKPPVRIDRDTYFTPAARP